MIHNVGKFWWLHNTPNYLNVPVRSIVFVKDVYKTVGYKAPFDEAEKLIILEKLNNLSEENMQNCISKKDTASIQEHIRNSGYFEVPEQLLDIPSIETVKLEKICQSMLGKNKSLADKKKKIKVPFLQAIKPTVKEEVEPDSKVLGLRVTSTSVFYCLIQEKNLLAWNNIVLFNDISATNYAHPKLYSKIQNAVAMLPDADYCIQEEMTSLLKTDNYLKNKGNQMKTCSYMNCILQGSGKIRSNTLHHIQRANITKMFGLKIGNERLSMMDRIFSIVEVDIFGENPFELNISGEQRENFMSLQYSERGNQAEFLAGAALQAIAFRRIADLLRVGHIEAATNPEKYLE